MNPNQRTALIQAFAGFKTAIFAVVDGGHFAGFGKLAKSAGLVSKPLYHQRNLSTEAVDAGPHVVAMTSQDILHRLLDLVDGAPAVVFWAWDGKEDALHTHLRKLNVVEIEQKIYGDIGHKPVMAAQKVIFRHADPDVLEVTMLSLTPEQRTEVFGAAKGIAHFPPSIGEVRTWA